MFGTMTNTEAIQMIGVMFIIGAVAVLLLVLGAVFWPETQRGAAAVSAWVSSRREDGSLDHELGSYSYREPADPRYVDALIRARGRAPVVYAPDPLPELLPAAEVLRYVLPALPVAKPAPVHIPSPYSPYRVQLAELVANVREAQPLPLPSGRHRAPELVAA